MNRPESVSASLACGLTEEIVRTFGGVRLRVFGTSMVPSILPGDFITVQLAGLSEISIGEIVLYSREGRLFVHRVRARAGGDENAALITRGDRLSQDDPAVSSAELLGRVVNVQTDDGRGRREARLPAQMPPWDGLVMRILRTSDHATFLYLRLAERLPGFFSRRQACRA